MPFQRLDPKLQKLLEILPLIVQGTGSLHYTDSKDTVPQCMYRPMPAAHHGHYTLFQIAGSGQHEINLKLLFPYRFFFLLTLT